MSSFYRRNISDEELAYMIQRFKIGDLEAIDTILNSPALVINVIAEMNAEQVAEIITQIRDNKRRLQKILVAVFDSKIFDNGDLEYILAIAYPQFTQRHQTSDNFFNVFKDRYPVVSLDVYGLSASLNEVYSIIRQLWPFLYNFYTSEEDEREIWDIEKQKHVIIQKEILINTSTDPPFNLSEGKPIPLPGYDPYVKLFLIESFDDVDVAPEDFEEDVPEDAFEISRYWINIYERGQAYGGPEEGGWWRETYAPVGTLYVGEVEIDPAQPWLTSTQTPEFINQAREFIEGIIEELGQEDLVVFLEPHCMMYQVYPEGPYQ
jgi:hypothetical protein